MAWLRRLLAASTLRPVTPRRSRQLAARRLACFERLEPKTPLAVDVSFTSDTPILDGPTINTLTLTYSSASDSAELVVSGDFLNGSNMSWSVTGTNGTRVTGTPAGTWPYAIVVVVNSAERELPSSSFVLSAPGAMEASDYFLAIGSLSVSGLGSVSIAPPLVTSSWTTETPISISAGSIAFGSSLTANYEVFNAPALQGGNVVLRATAGSIMTQDVSTSAIGGVFDAGVLAGGSIAMTAATTISTGELTVAAMVPQGEDLGPVFYEPDDDDTSGQGGTVTLTAGEAISVGSITGASSTTIDQDDAVSSASDTRVAGSGVRASRQRGGEGIVTGAIRGSGAVSILAASGPIRLVGDLTTGPRDGSPASILLDGAVDLRRTARLTTTSGESLVGGPITFTGPVNGRHPLAIAAGGGEVAFRSVVGGAEPLAGLRVENAGAVVATSRVHVAGGFAGAFRHGIELVGGVNNVNLSQGGTIRGFTSGQAVHIGAGTVGSAIQGFRMVNSGRPFVGWGGPDKTAALSNNTIVRVVARRATARITAGGGKTNDPLPTIAGTARSGDRITLYADGRAVGSTLAVRGKWTIVPSRLPDGTHRLTVRAIGRTGVASGVSAPVDVFIQTSRPSAPTIALAPGSDTGIPGDMTTSTTRPWLTGTATPGSTIQVSIDGRAIGRAVAGANGVWRLRVATPLARHQSLRRSEITTTARDGFGNTSPDVSVTLVTDTRSIAGLYRDYAGTIGRTKAERAFARHAFEGYVWGRSFAWLYGRRKQQEFGAAGPAAAGALPNRFLVQQDVVVKSSDRIAPDVNVIYANAFLHVLPGQPVIVNFPDTAAAGGHFAMLQVCNSASETIASFSSFENAPGNAGIPQGGSILFYRAGDTRTYAGDFVRRVAVNTDVVLAAGRVLVGAGQAAVEPFAVESAVALASQFLAADYGAYAANSLSMVGITNPPLTAVDDAIREAYARYSRPLEGLHFWEMLGAAVAQSPLPTAGPGSAVDPLGRTPQQYLASFAPLGLSAGGWSDAGLTPRQLELLARVATSGNRAIDDLVSAAANAGSGWANVPSTLGNYPNNPIGYLERDVAHVANTPEFAVYPTLARDAAGNTLSGSNTYVMLLPREYATPPLAAGAAANTGGFWSFTAYDTNYNVTPSLPDYRLGVADVLGAAAVPLIGNPNNSGSKPNVTVSSLQSPGAFGAPAVNQYHVEPDGTVMLIFSPTAPQDTRYLNNWIPTPLVTFKNPRHPNEPGRFVAGDQFNVMLRVYTPAVETRGADARLMSGGRPWPLPTLRRVDGLTDLPRIDVGVASRQAATISALLSFLGGLESIERSIAMPAAGAQRAVPAMAFAAAAVDVSQGRTTFQAPDAAGTPNSTEFTRYFTEILPPIFEVANAPESQSVRIYSTPVVSGGTATETVQESFVRYQVLFTNQGDPYDASTVATVNSTTTITAPTAAAFGTYGYPQFAVANLPVVVDKTSTAKLISPPADTLIHVDVTYSSGIELVMLAQTAPGTTTYVSSSATYDSSPPDTTLAQVGVQSQSAGTRQSTSVGSSVWMGTATCEAFGFDQENWTGQPLSLAVGASNVTGAADAPKYTLSGGSSLGAFSVDYTVAFENGEIAGVEIPTITFSNGDTLTVSSTGVGDSFVFTVQATNGSTSVTAVLTPWGDGTVTHVTPYDTWTTDLSHWQTQSWFYVPRIPLGILL